MNASLRTALVAAVVVLGGTPPAAARPDSAKVAVFGFELDDRSAGGGVTMADPIDAENLEKSTEVARSLLTEAGRYSLVDTGNAAGEASAAPG